MPVADAAQRPGLGGETPLSTQVAIGGGQGPDYHRRADPLLDGPPDNPHSAPTENLLQPAPPSRRSTEGVVLAECRVLAKRPAGEAEPVQFWLSDPPPTPRCLPGPNCSGGPPARSARSSPCPRSRPRSRSRATCPSRACSPRSRSPSTPGRGSGPGPPHAGPGLERPPEDRLGAAALPGAEDASYDRELSVAPGWKTGGWAPRSFTDPAPRYCRVRDSRMEPLLTLATAQRHADLHSWSPYEDRATDSGHTNCPDPARPTMITVGDATTSSSTPARHRRNTRTPHCPSSRSGCRQIRTPFTRSAQARSRARPNPYVHNPLPAVRDRAETDVLGAGMPSAGAAVAVPGRPVLGRDPD